MSEKIWILIFSLEVSIILIFLIYTLTKNRGNNWYQKSPKFYLAANILCIYTLINVILLNIKEFFFPPDILERYFRANTIQSLVAIVYVWGLFVAGALGIIWAGVKSIIEQESITPGPSIRSHRYVTGIPAIISGIIYILIGLFFLFGLILVAVEMFLEMRK